jgi:hypothetical protein
MRGIAEAWHFPNAPLARRHACVPRRGVIRALRNRCRSLARAGRPPASPPSRDMVDPHACLRRRIAANIKAAEPKRIMEEGSGTCAVKNSVTKPSVLVFPLASFAPFTSLVNTRETGSPSYCPPRWCPRWATRSSRLSRWGSTRGREDRPVRLSSIVQAACRSSTTSSSFGPSYAPCQNCQLTIRKCRARPDLPCSSITWRRRRNAGSRTCKKFRHGRLNSTLR